MSHVLLGSAEHREVKKKAGWSILWPSISSRPPLISWRCRCIANMAHRLVSVRTCPAFLDSTGCSSAPSRCCHGHTSRTARSRKEKRKKKEAHYDRWSAITRCSRRGHGAATCVPGQSSESSPGVRPRRADPSFIPERERERQRHPHRARSSILRVDNDVAGPDLHRRSAPFRERGGGAGRGGRCSHGDAHDSVSTVNSQSRRRISVW